jgi:hypothetical protein
VKERQKYMRTLGFLFQVTFPEEAKNSFSNKELQISIKE